MVMGTRNAALEPFATRVCGLRVLSPDRVVVLAPRATSAQAIANLNQNGEVSVCASWPRNFRTLQIKGQSLQIADGTPEDREVCERQLQDFCDAVVQFGITRAQSRNLWLFDVWRVEIQVTSIFEQTPGPGAGRRLGVEAGRRG